MSQSRRQGLGIWLLLHQVFGVIGVNNIPPATLVITALQVLIFLRAIPVPWNNPSDVCISVDSVWNRREWLRLLLGAVEHGSDWHLYYNMISFIWKGISLERRFGSARFAYLISVFTVLCSVTLVGLSHLASEFSDRYYSVQCAVGFSGVLFALKVLTTHYWPNSTPQVMGLPIEVPVQYLVWIELLLIHFLVPNASFLGHAAGILVGLAYIHTPLGSVIDSGWQVVQTLLTGVTMPNPNRTYYRSNIRSNFSPEGMTEDEQFEFARQESLRSQYGRHYNSASQSNSGRQHFPSPSYHTYDQPRPSAPFFGDGSPRQRSTDLPYPEADFMPQSFRNRGPSLYPDLNDMR